MRRDRLHRSLLLLSALIAPLVHWRQAGRKSYVKKIGESVQFKLRTNFYDRWATRQVWERGDYDDDSLPIHPADIVVDIGAHIGAFSVWAAKRAPQGRVYAFEPNRENYDLLVENVRLNGLTNVETFHAAVSDREGEAVLFHSKYSSVSHSFFESGDRDCATVRSISLAGIMESNRLDRVDYLKVDAEGAEYLILLNAPPETLKKVNRIFIEFHDSLDHGYNCRELQKHLADNGFDAAVDVRSLFGMFFRIGYIKAARTPPDKEKAALWDQVRRKESN